MKKLLIPLLFLLLSFSSFVFPDARIISITVYGNRNVSEERILLLMKTRPGDEFNEGVLKNDVRQLAQTGFFSGVRYETEEKDGVNIKLYVTENPVIGDIKFTGNRVFRSKQLTGFLGMKKGDILNEVKLIEGIEAVKEKYREKKFYLIEVDHEIEETEKDEVILRLLVNEQGRSYVKRMIFEGNDSAPESQLRRMMKVKQRKMPFIRGTFKKDLFDRDLEKIRTYYADKGYLESTVAGDVSADKKDGLLVVEITVNEGKQYSLGNVGFRGNLVFPEEELKNRLSLKEKNSLFSRSTANENIRNLSTFYMDKGYLRARVEEIPSAGEAPGLMDVTYFIEPGEIYHAGEIIVRGNTKTKDKVIRREIRVEPGDKIIPDKMRTSFNRLFDLNYFEKIDIYPEFVHEGNIANVVVDVEEKERTGIFLIGGGYSSIDDIIGVVSVQQSNFNLSGRPSFVGGGQNLAFTVELGTEARNFRLSFMEPYLFDKPVWFGTDLYRTRRQWSYYTEQRTGGALKIGRRWDRASLGLAARIEEIGLSDMEIPSLIGQEGDARKHSLTGSFSYSTLDSRRSPSKGNLARLSLEYAGEALQGDIDFLKPVLENDFYLSLNKLVFHSRMYAGTVKELDDTTEIPIYERFFGGGIGTVRGYKERSLGPRDAVTDEPVGGYSLFAKNFELIYPLYEDILKGVLFFDMGNVWEDWGEFGSLRKSAGAGVKMVVPFLNAPIEIYYGHAFDREKGDPEGRWHFGMSFAF